MLTYSLKLSFLLLLLSISKKAICNNYDTTINCLIFFNDKILYPQDCKNFLAISKNSLSKSDTISLTFNIGTLSLKKDDLLLLKQNNNADISFEYFYDLKETGQKRKKLSLLKCFIIFENHKYIIVRIFDMELKKNKRKYFKTKEGSLIFSYETPGASQILLTH